jgi:peptide/nickel transport system substrate-binding protein
VAQVVDADDLWSVQEYRMATKPGLTRRSFLKTGVVGLAGVSLLSACAPAPPAAKPAETKAAEPAKPAEAAKPAAPAAAATTAPAAAPAKPAEAAKPSEAAKPAAAAPKLGAQLIGKLEGPSIVTDPAQMPKAFKEAPALTELVNAGKLPPVQERIGQDPLVVKPVHEIGKYGGTWRHGFTGPGDNWNGMRNASGPDHLLFWDYIGDKIVPNIAKGFELQDGGKVTVIHLRRGMKWSDGAPFTADDFVFGYEDLYLNKDLYPTGSALLSINGKAGKVEKADQYTVRFVFPEPYPFLPSVLAGSTHFSAHSYAGDPSGVPVFSPAHYLKQFLPKYSSEDAINKMAKEAGFDNWALHLKNKNSFQYNPDLPVLTPWKTVSPINTPNWTLERNPYSVWVDTDGNQLPYIDKVQFQLAENLEVLNLRAIAGEYDMQSRHIDMGKLPVFLENQQRGNYKMALDIGDNGADCALKFNLGYEADPEIGKWLANVDFRRALALGIDRDQINETFWLGTGTGGSVAPSETNKYSPGPEYRTKWATLDINQANAMLDKLGLDKKDAEGYRLRTDGKGRLSLLIDAWGGQFIQFTRISEMISQQVKKIGIDLKVQEIERSFGIKRNAANENQIYAWQNDGSEHLFTFPGHVFPYDGGSSGGPQFGQWFQSNGAQGKEPPPRLKEVMEKFRRAFGVPEEEQVKLGKEIWAIAVDEVFSAGVVGLAAAVSGVRVIKNTMGNIPARQFNSPDGKTPGTSRPATFFFKS